MPKSEDWDWVRDMTPQAMFPGLSKFTEDVAMLTRAFHILTHIWVDWKSEGAVHPGLMIEMDNFLLGVQKRADEAEKETCPSMG